jgi:hypothetical protein
MADFSSCRPIVPRTRAAAEKNDRQQDNHGACLAKINLVEHVFRDATNEYLKDLKTCLGLTRF